MLCRIAKNNALGVLTPEISMEALHCDPAFKSCREEGFRNASDGKLSVATVRVAPGVSRPGAHCWLSEVDRGVSGLAEVDGAAVR